MDIEKIKQEFQDKFMNTKPFDSNKQFKPEVRGQLPRLFVKFLEQKLQEAYAESKKEVEKERKIGEYAREDLANGSYDSGTYYFPSHKGYKYNGFRNFQFKWDCDNEITVSLEHSVNGDEWLSPDIFSINKFGVIDGNIDPGEYTRLKVVLKSPSELLLISNRFNYEPI